MCWLYYNIFKSNFEKLTALRDVHEFDSDFLLIFFMFAKHHLAETALTQFFYYLIVVQNSTKVEFLALNGLSERKNYPLLLDREYRHLPRALYRHWTEANRSYYRAWRFCNFLCSRISCTQFSAARSTASPLSVLLQPHRSLGFSKYHSIWQQPKWW